ncbi:MAG: high frequency lysogenization protein HflD [Candidatus Thiodiazotropha endolucinida]|uniref:High frequency lysogenization protein HflD homolog n=2 Tax=Candidatus Thiodiazotropha TaxID=1913444 RepID=A0A7Z0VHI2_9GAMM|nr:high frequency lysogenization protein HflD [Candidatus Thiodiazotropha endolucinida]MBT3018058.1 high frequency lysogenization protein HflD [Candidatus Thiodiazotropha taylori]MBT3029902.1 high frequency lysogenization protein HflD [Candidatus Thiodiazotropha sp. (ex Lucina pensylvanica)]MBT3038611.1 high frequency lysogenization protein HflD [Candidatus Thiodiazotropha sp. (ex Codakia orbicularis)]MCU7943950.1 high frequency lysogenization protein HflD [Candidatus Thiodiazotropha sp. (ex Ca
MQYRDSDRAIALSGIYQAANLVQQVARRGLVDADSIAANIHSLFQIDAESVQDVYGGLEGITPGLRLTYRQLSGEEARDDELTRYLLGLIQLERKLSRHLDRLERIKHGITTIAQRLAHFPATHSNILGALAEIYADNISQLSPRIMVSGEPVYLQNNDNVNKIRALLLSGIRAATLWRQTGGRRRQLLFVRKRYIQACRELLDDLHQDI